MTTKRTTTSRAKAAQAKAKTATADTEKEPVVAAGLAKFINPEADTVDAVQGTDTAEAVEGADTEGVAEQDETRDAGDTAQEAGAGPDTIGQDPEAEVSVTVVVDAITIRPGLLASEGQTVSLPGAQADRLIGLGAVRRA